MMRYFNSQLIIKYVLYCIIICTSLNAYTHASMYPLNEKVIARFDMNQKNTQTIIQTHFHDIASIKNGYYVDIIMSYGQFLAYQHQGFWPIIVITESKLKQNLQSRRDALNGYRTYENVVDEMTTLQDNFKSICKVYSLGYSWGHYYDADNLSNYESYNHQIWAVKISDQVQIEEDEPSFYFMGLHHAKETISLEVVMAELNYILYQYGKDDNVTQLVHNNQLWFIPLVNPDGHRVVMDQRNVFWRKNIRDNNNNTVIDNYDGVDLNRNYNFKWGSLGSSSIITSDIYRGPTKGSEPEIEAIQTFLSSHHFVAGVSYHSYGELVVFPYGYDYQATAPDHDALNDLAIHVAQKIPSINGGYYEPMQSIDMYPVGGDHCDYAYGIHGIFSLTIELANQFIPPVDQINPICNGNIQGAMVLLNRVNYATLTGHIKDSHTGKPLEAEIFIPLVDSKGSDRNPYKSDETFGRYYRLLMPGQYSVVISAPLYDTQTIENIIITSNSQTQLSVSMVRSTIQGDVNQDSVIDLKDLMILMKYMSEIKKL